ncbi:unnamed protein product [Blepharisma stoltei]|uniref:Uncharacterized protein n=1 Tax=Blepharisma stoltei TaxID=1481888 RepID=A0AAU9JXM3_9CILI|nr:unnamed protein product [Blepharisma stoltei]
MFPSQRIQNLISSVKEKVEKEFQNDRDNFGACNTSALERSKNLKEHIYELSKYMISKKKEYNEIHNEVLQKQQKLFELKKTYTEMEDQISQPNHIEDLFKVRKEEHHDFTQGLNNELYYQETLKQMLFQRQENVNRSILPVNTISSKLKLITSQLANRRHSVEKISADITNINQEIEIAKNELARSRILNHQKIENELKVYQDYQKVLKCISAEHKRNLTIEKQKENSLQLIRLEKKISELKEFHVVHNETIKLEKDQEKQDSKFKAIQRVTNISTIQDMLPYYKYLKEKTENLSSTASQYQSLIDSLNKEIKELSYELNRYKFQDGSYELNAQKIEEIKAAFELRISTIEKDESSLNSLQNLVFSAVNVISRIVFQLSDESSRFDVTAKNLNHALAYISSKLDTIIGTLENHKNVYYVESINTATDFTSSPPFLKLNNSSFYQY